jgi:DNA-binding CsgD family transcriptional regulator
MTVEQRVLDRLKTLSPSERETLRYLAAGMNAWEISKARNVSIHTVKSQIHNILYKLRVHTQLQAVVLFYQRELMRSRVSIGGEMFFQLDPRGKLFVVNGYPDAELNVQSMAVTYPDSIFFYADLTTEE